MSFSVHTLSSGLKAYFQRRDLGWFGCRLMIGCGMRHDPPGKEELAHLLEHHLATGIKGYPPMSPTELERWAIAQLFEMDFGATSIDHTYYGGKAPVDRMEAFFRFLRDMVLRPRLDGDLEHDKEIIRNERRTRTTPEMRRADQLRHRTVFGDHRLATAMDWAPDKVLSSLTHADLRAAHKRFYRSPNMTIFVVGGLEEKLLLQALEKLFPAAPRGYSPPARPKPIDFSPPTRKEHRTRKQGKVSSVLINHHWYLPPSRRAPFILARNGLRMLLNDRIRERLRATYGVSIDEDLHQDHMLVETSIEVAPAQVERVRAVIEETLRDDEALIEALPQLKGEFLLEMTFLELDIEETLGNALTTVSLSGGMKTLAELKADIITVGDDEVRKALACLSPEAAYVELIET